MSLLIRSLISPLISSLAFDLASTVAIAQEGAGHSTGPKRPEITVELNKLEVAGNACRGYFLVGNGASQDIKELRLDVFLFDKSGIILRRVGLTFPDIQAARSRVVLFDFPEIGCLEIGRLMVNDVLTCANADGAPVENCGRMVITRTRANATFIY